MNDKEIIGLFWSRSENAIAECEKKYGRICRQLAGRILESREDAEEAERDAYLKAWQTIPPEKPMSLGAYLSTLCRRSALDIWRRRHRDKRGGGQIPQLLNELAECGPDGADETVIDRMLLREALNRFLASLPKRDRILFMKRYWWSYSVAELAEEFSMNENTVKTKLMRIREKLRERLEKEGIPCEKDAAAGQ